MCRGLGCGFQKDCLLSSFQKPYKAGAVHIPVLEPRKLMLRGLAKEKGWGQDPNYSSGPTPTSSGRALSCHLAARNPFLHLGAKQTAI